MERDILQHFREIKSIIGQGKAQALQAVNAHLLHVNWQVGAYLSTRLTAAAYGDKIVDQLAKWLQAEEPTLKGFDKRTLYRMKEFFEVWQSLDQDLLPPAMKENYILPERSPEAKKIVGSVTPQSEFFPLEVLDRDVRKPHENPSIGVVLCKTKDDEVVEIALSRQLSPTLVAAYQTKFVDKDLLRRMLHQWADDWYMAREAQAIYERKKPAQ